MFVPRYIPPRQEPAAPTGTAPIKAAPAASGKKRRAEAASTSVEASQNAPKKRKHTDKADTSRPQKQSRPNHETGKALVDATDEIGKDEKKNKERKERKERKKEKKQRQQKSVEEEAAPGEPSGINAEDQANGETVNGLELANGAVEDNVALDTTDGQPGQQRTDRDAKRRKKREKRDLLEANTDEPSKAHSRILKKYEKSAQAPVDESATEEQEESDDRPAPVLRDLVPIPRPKASAALRAKPTFSALPLWLAEPIEVPLDEIRSFAELSIDDSLVEKLKEQGFENALPVQAGVLPLLLPTSKQHPGDVCVSAATGSGKTIAYVLPIVQSLRSRIQTRLRAVVVVPTRELVSQVRQVTDMCCKGTDLRVGTAVGSHTLKQEQDSLVQRNDSYDPACWEILAHTLNQPADNLRDDADPDRQATIEEAVATLPFHVPVYSSKVDILICTPGRLVDHIKNTRGFSLGAVEWLVIDEADRLLDQSFQDWAQTVNGSLPKTRRGRCFQRGARKVVLSATMTRDLDQLDALKLQNPRLVAVGGLSAELARLDNAQSSGMTLPPTLHEYAVPVGDGSDKPLYMMQLLDVLFGRTSCFSRGGGLVKTVGSKVAAKSHEDEGDDDDESEVSSVVSSSVVSSTAASDNDDNGDDDSSSVVSSSSAVSSSSIRSSSSIGSSSGVSDATADSLSSLSSVLSEEESESSASAAEELLTSESSSATAQGLAQDENEALGEAKATSSAAHIGQAKNVLIFTSTNEAALRLASLLTMLSSASSSGDSLAGSSNATPKPYRVAAVTKQSTRAATRATLQAFARGQLDVLVASDRMARGLDLPGLDAVVCYDVARSVVSYVHRAGRTARAGRGGAAWTLLEDREARWFWRQLGGSDKESPLGRPGGRGVQRTRLAGHDSRQQDLGWDAAAAEHYAGALARMKQSVSGSG